MDDLLVNDGTNEEILIDYDPASLTEEWQKNSAWSLSLTALKTARNSITYAMLKNESKIIYQGQQFVINHTDPKGTGPLSTIDISAPHIYFTCQDHRQYDKQSKIWSIDEAMDWAFGGNVHGFTWETVGSFPTVQIDNFGDANALSMLSDILSKFGGVLEADNKHLIIYSEAEWGMMTDKQIRYQYNTDEVQMSIDTSAIKTVIRGYGKQNEDGSYVFPPVTYESPNIGIYGERHADPIRDDRFTNEDSMRAYLPSQLNDEPDVSITAPLKVKEDVQRGEHRLLIYEPMDLDIDVQIIAYKKYPAVNKPPEVTSSNTVKDAVNVMSGFSAAASTVNKVIDSSGSIKDTALSPTVSESVIKINDLTTPDGKLDLTKSEGKLQEDQSQIGPGTTFAAGYDPSQINIPYYDLATGSSDGLLSSDDKNKLDDIPGQGNALNVTATDKGLAFPEMYKTWNSIPKDTNWAITLVTLTDPGLMAPIDKKYLNLLKSWTSDPDIVPQIFNPTVKPDGMIDMPLADWIKSLNDRITALGG
ncbi:phage tail protein [Sporolactobacillus sp. CQH2019]|uniref:phage tail protein n=1 Tax=Sporolactobacillus sp. CQH2019 TaxID=3023512 RepID=UPI002367E14A|nr:phage tail protein [Sporolactobacillus sp. CQH2019]MDD9148164.1 phage tail protein [Sporolactobacillus sp. CQH2019]